MPKPARVYTTRDPRLTISTLPAGPARRYALTLLANGRVTFRAQREAKGWWLDTGPRYIGAWRGGALEDGDSLWTVNTIFDAHPLSKLPSALAAPFRKLLTAATRKK